MEASVIKLEDIVSFREIEYETTYDISVEGNDNFYLATNSDPILVHNSGKSEFTDYNDEPFTTIDTNPLNRIS